MENIRLLLFGGTQRLTFRAISASAKFCCLISSCMITTSTLLSTNRHKVHSHRMMLFCASPRRAARHRRALHVRQCNATQYIRQRIQYECVDVRSHAAPHIAPHPVWKNLNSLLERSCVRRSRTSCSVHERICLLPRIAIGPIFDGFRSDSVVGSS